MRVGGVAASQAHSMPKTAGFHTSDAEKAKYPNSKRFTSHQRLFRRTEAAEYIGVSASHFDKLVLSNEMPSPIRLGKGTVRWDKLEIDRRIDDLYQPSLIRTHAPTVAFPATRCAVG